VEGDTGAGWSLAGDQEKRGWEVYGRREKRGRKPEKKEKKLHNIVQYFTIRKMQRGGNQQNTGQEGVREAGGLNPPVSLSSAEVR